MKRKRRIEITRYSRRITAAQGDDVAHLDRAAPDVAEALTIDIEVKRAVPPTPEEICRDLSAGRTMEPPVSPLRRLLRLLSSIWRRRQPP